MTILTSVLQVSDAVAGVFGILDRRFDLDHLIHLARQRTGLRNFGDTAFIGPLSRLLDACAREAALSLVGRSATSWDVVRFLSNLLTVQAAFDEQPEMAAAPIHQPIFITGLPRSGTTFLHRLMLTDEANRAPAVWETIYPSGMAGTREQRIAKVARQLKAFEWLAPQFRGLHPLEAISPQECSEITAHVFRSLRFDTTHHVPSYRMWLDADVVRHMPAYRFHKQFLQYLQQQDGVERRWVLKCPEHLFALNSIKAVYPDARLVFVHRDPVKVLLSQAKLTEVVRRPFTRRLDPKAVGPNESRRWFDGTRRMMALDDETVCHVHHIDLISDPVSSVERVYRHFGMDLPAEAASAMQSYIASRPNGGYGGHRYDFADHGLDEQQERERFRPYMVHFSVAAEDAGQRRSATPRSVPASSPQTSST